MEENADNQNDSEQEVFPAIYFVPGYKPAKPLSRKSARECKNMQDHFGNALWTYFGEDLIYYKHHKRRCTESHQPDTIWVPVGCLVKKPIHAGRRQRRQDTKSIVIRPSSICACDSIASGSSRHVSPPSTPSTQVTYQPRCGRRIRPRCATATSLPALPPQYLLDRVFSHPVHHPYRVCFANWAACRSHTAFKASSM